MSRSEVLYEPRGRGLGSIKPKDKEHKGAERHRGAGAGDLPGRSRSVTRSMPWQGDEHRPSRRGGRSLAATAPDGRLRDDGHPNCASKPGIGHIESKMG
jgi:hypothetical protein